VKLFLFAAALLAGAPLMLRADPPLVSAASPLTRSAAAAPAEGPVLPRVQPREVRDPRLMGRETDAPPPLAPSEWSQRGLEYRFSMGAVKVPNGQALSYMPLEVGWRFADGWRLRLGVELFYYTGLYQDGITAGEGLVGPQVFYYEMEDIRLSALYEWPWHSRWRPLAGMTIDTVSGSRQLSYVFGPSTPTPPSSVDSGSAYTFSAPGAEVGMEYRGGPHWSLSLEARYVVGVGYWANMAGTDFGWHYLF
jgi:hypothetical protein